MVGRYAGLEVRDPAVVSKHSEVARREMGRPPLGGLADLASLSGCRKP